MTLKSDIRAKGRRRADPNASLGFSNEKFIALLSQLTGVQPVGELGRETPLDLTSLEAARATLLFRELYSKYDDGLPSESKERTTWERFQMAEEMCRQTNLRFYEVANRDPFWVNVRRRIWTVLGKFDWDEASKGFGHGPGGTTRLPKAKSAAAYKYSGKPESTSGNAVLASCAIAQVPLWTQSVLKCEDGDLDEWPEDIREDVRAELSDREVMLRTVEDIRRRGLVIVDGNSVITVPKSYKTHRTIAKEPCMNVYIQKGIGRAIRKRLYSVGVNLDDQTRNQRGALQGSLTGELATVDLSMASDTLSYEVVSWLLPNDWWFALEQCRSPVGALPSGEKINYQKFSSMGNGYTFELESLIFWAICQQVCCPDVNEREMSICVYGDDLIVPSIHFEALVSKLREAGFEPNSKKSFSTGLFRESCGKQYYAGFDITPFYVRREVKHLDRLFLVHNNVYRWGDRTGVDVSDICASLRRLAPSSWRDPRLPDGFGDGAFIGAVDELRMDSHPHGWEYWQVSALAQSSIELEGDLPVGQLVASLYATEARSKLLSRSLVTRLRVMRRKVSRKSYAVPRSRHYAGHGEASSYCPEWAVDTDLEFPNLEETISGLPVRAGRFKEIKILIPRYPG